MTTDHWLNILQIISTLIAAVIGSKLVSRRRKPAPIPETNQPRKRIQIIADWVAEKPLSFWVWSALLIGFGLFKVFWTLRHQEPLDRDQIAAIIMAQVLLAFLFLLLFVTLALDTAVNSMHQGFQRAIQKVIEENNQWLKKINDVIVSHFEKSEPRPEGLISRIKKLL